MKKYELTENLNQAIVDGMVEGYTEYLSVRRRMSRELKVSSAYAWVKGNHIDDKVATACEKLGVDSQLSKAGQTWQYLQFKLEQEKVLFIIKNGRYFNKEQVSKGRDVKGASRKTKMEYMEDLMNINAPIDFAEISSYRKQNSNQLALELFEEFRLNEEDIKQISKLDKEGYEKFYIATYEIDETQAISNISLWLPNPVDNKAYLIEDLTTLIAPDVDYNIDEELMDVLVSTSTALENTDAHVFGIGIDEEEEEKKDSN